ncbi:MAG: putative DNA modification/repair radical SAM protein [Desulfobacterales bacterium]|jgi:probable DNA metabolism protein
MRIEDKLAILADAAKYDVSCASSGSRRKNVGRRLGNAAPSGICHTYTEDGRCVSLLKILYTNACIFDCAYCVNRHGNDIPRSAFTLKEIVSLTIDFYRRNYIEGLFLSSGIMRSPDDTMERLIRTVQNLRKQGFNGYIHVKCVPYASRRLIRQAGIYADRLSVNIELPSEKSLKQLTSNKTYASVLEPMGVIREAIAETRDSRKRLRHVPPFAPAGQSTQLIIGASPESDYAILDLADRLYRRQTLKRVYYSAYVPVGQMGTGLPNIADPPLRRENRLYQADWLMRLYGFAIDEVISAESPYLDLKIDPKQAFAQRHPALFPIDINAADRESILRVPGIGLKSANRIVSLRHRGRIRFEHLKQLGVVVSRAQSYIRCDGLPTGQWQGASLTRRSQIPQIPQRQGSLKAVPAREAQLVFVTDGTFEGLLTAIFDAYTAERPPEAVESSGSDQLGLFTRRITIPNDPTKSERVWKGLKTHLGPNRRRELFDAYLSGSPGVETMIYRFVRDAIPGRSALRSEADLTSHIQIEKLCQKVRREAHRMKGFIRFQQTGEDRYLALVAPRYDVLPLIRRHFESRFADQWWIIYDTVRNYGLCYDRHKTCEMRLDVTDLKAPANDHDDDEKLCQTLWQRYYAAINISLRNNPKLHLRQLPRRFWRYLPEKRLTVWVATGS